MLWIENDDQCVKFFEIVNEYARPLVFGQAKMLPGSRDDNAEEIIGDLNLQLAQRMQDHRDGYSDPTTHDGQVWRCPDPESAAEMSYTTYLLRSLVKNAVTRIRSSHLRMRQSEVLDSLPSPPTNDIRLQEKLEDIFSQAKNVLPDDQYAFFTVECSHRAFGSELSDKREEFDQNQRKRWSRILAKVRAAAVISLLPILFGGFFVAPVHGAELPGSAKIADGYLPHQGMILPPTGPATLHQG